MSKKKKTFLVVHKETINRFDGMSADDAIFQYAKERLGFDNTQSVSIESAHKIAEIVNVLPEVRCYELVRDEQYRLSPNSMKNLTNKLKLAQAIIAKIEAEKEKKRLETQSIRAIQLKEIALLKQLMQKYPSGHIFDEDDNE